MMKRMLDKKKPLSYNVDEERRSRCILEKAGDPQPYK